MLKFQSELLQEPHLFCLKLTPSTEFAELYQSIVCGERLTNPQFLKAFRDSGLMHIMVVSGSHLLTLRGWIRWPRLQIPILLFYCCVTSFQPPVARGIIQLLLQQSTSRLGWSSNLCVFVSGLLTWAMVPEWINSLSFQLSWICATALSLTENRNIFVRAIILYFSTAIVLAQFYWPHPISILMNATIAPLVGAILFPASLLCFIFPPMVFVTDFLWKALLVLCNLVTSGNIMFPEFEIGTLKVWIILWFLSLSVHIRRVLLALR